MSKVAQPEPSREALWFGYRMSTPNHCTTLPFSHEGFSRISLLPLDYWGSFASNSVHGFVLEARVIFRSPTGFLVTGIVWEAKSVVRCRHADNLGAVAAAKRGTASTKLKCVATTYFRGIVTVFRVEDYRL